VAGNAFHATGPQTEKARSPSLVRILGTTNIGHVDDRKPWRWVVGDGLNHVTDIDWTMLLTNWVH